MPTFKIEKNWIFNHNPGDIGHYCTYQLLFNTILYTMMPQAKYFFLQISYGSKLYDNYFWILQDLQNNFVFTAKRAKTEREKICAVADLKIQCPSFDID